MHNVAILTVLRLSVAGMVLARLLLVIAGVIPVLITRPALVEHCGHHPDRHHRPSHHGALAMTPALLKEAA